MKKLIASIVWLFLNFCSLFAQINALNFETSLTGDFANNFRGGIKKGFTYIGMEELSLTLNTEPAKLWKGGTLFIHGLNLHGNGPTAKYVGDLQVMSNIEAGDFTSLYECYYSQELGQFTFLLGQHDLNAEFAVSNNGSEFLNSSFGITPSISLNVPTSIFPVTSPCILIRYTSNENLIFRCASYYGNPGNIDNNKFNINWHFSRKHGLMNICEIEYSRIKKNDNSSSSTSYKTGTFKLGVYYHSGDFISPFDTVKIEKGNYGLYILADQLIIPKPSKPDEGLAVMIQFGFAPSNLNLINYYFGTGLGYYGLLKARNKDYIGISLANAIISKSLLEKDPQRLKAETAIEFTYKFCFNDNYSIQPDLQYIIHPGAIKGIKNSLTGLLRFKLSF
jgi:porin